MSEILSDAELLRYNRQIILKSFDFEGQEALKQARVLVIGAGGLGCAASQYLAVAGVGQLTLVDFDKVELSNLQRQVLHNDERIGHYKVDSAAQSLRALNPGLRYRPTLPWPTRCCSMPCCPGISWYWIALTTWPFATC